MLCKVKLSIRKLKLIQVKLAKLFAKLSAKFLDKLSGQVRTKLTDFGKASWQSEGFSIWEGFAATIPTNKLELETKEANPWPSTVDKATVLCSFHFNPKLSKHRLHQKHCRSSLCARFLLGRTLLS